jgi:hypothetical protein
VNEHKQPLVLFFYPAAGTPGCTKEVRKELWGPPGRTGGLWRGRLGGAPPGPPRTPRAHTALQGAAPPRAAARRIQQKPLNQP